MLTNISKLSQAWAHGWAVAAILVLFAVFIAVTLPGFQSAPGGDIQPLDSRLFYTPGEAYSVVESYGEARGFWMRLYLTWDIVTPIAYGTGLSLLISWLFARGLPVESGLQRLNVLPLVAALFDALENLSIVTLMAAYPTKLTAVAWLSTICTVGKMSSLALSVLLIGFGLLMAARRRLFGK